MVAHLLAAAAVAGDRPYHQVGAGEEEGADHRNRLKEVEGADHRNRLKEVEGEVAEEERLTCRHWDVEAEVEVVDLNYGQAAGEASSGQDAYWQEAKKERH